MKIWFEFSKKFKCETKHWKLDFIHNLINFSKNQITYFKNQINSQSKQLNLNKINNNKFEDSEKDYINLLKEIVESENLKTENKSSDDELNQPSNEKFNDLNNFCAFSSFLTIYLYCIKPLITNKLNNSINFEKIIYDKNKNDEFIFELYMKFINEIISINMDDHYLYFYIIYENFNLSNNCNLYNLHNIEYKQMFQLY